MITPLNRTTREMKINNVVLVTSALKSLGSATKADLAGVTGLSIATCGAVLNDLSLSREVLALEREVSRGGRPAQRYAYNPDFFSVLSLYAQGSDAGAQIIWSVNTATGESLAQGEVRFLPLTLTRFYQQIERLLAEYPNIKALGIGLPGVVVKGTVATCDISAFAGVPVEQQLRERLGIYVQADNDMNYTAWGFYRSSCAGVTAPVAYLFKPAVPCLGCGMVVNGQVLHGASQFAGEVSNLPYQDMDKLPVAEEMAKVVISLAAIINPATIALSGPKISEALIPELTALCLQHIPAQHMPALIYRPSMRQDYLQGITELTLRNYNLHVAFGE
ncbi:ROK family protein [Rahnella victoriana]|uniref:ROK family protein n=1 Tax=Rahnella victoriana TaxID=1510570 RepID=UPI00103922E9|nr:ROK family protein [Rahnella victoriana]TBX36095.1 ROK family protein [Rahnella victoriana]UHM93305.1 ROK family protein [Rahnella victoriana]VTQ52678.1 N-acetyl-D-glucosamine kinase [Campylobacter jejuni]